MTQVTLIPELRTAGCEISELECDGKYAGTLMLAFREGERLVGGLQLDAATLSAREKDIVSSWTDDYVYALADALDVDECEVLVTFGKVDHIITNYDEEVIEEEPNLDDIDPGDRQEVLMREEPVRLELVIVGERDRSVEYHIYGPDKDWLAEAFFTIEEGDAVGEVNWMVRPTSDEIEAAADLIVSDFDEEEIDTIMMDMSYQDELLESYEMTHENLTDGGYEKQYSALLVRDDASALTYDIYEQSRGGLPIGRATVDISRRTITGMIEFREPTGAEEREKMASTLLRELDKEKDYDSVNITMMHHNRRIEQIYYENEPVH